MRNIHKFQTESEFKDFVAGINYIEPHVSLTTQNDKVDYNVQDRFRLMPLTFEILTNGTVKYRSRNVTFAPISYRKNDGDWTSITTSGTSISVVQGDILQFKGDNAKYGGSGENYYNGFDQSTCQFNLFGNIMSLIDSANFQNLTTLTNDCVFNGMFRETKVVNAKNLILPATNLTQNCYGSLFYNCDYLITIPELPATTLAYQCYENMFYSCNLLNVVPALPATTLAQSCYTSMFAYCTSLQTAPELPATTLAVNCYYRMFEHCTSLTTAPVLPATTMSYMCYYSMFDSCTSLTSAPALPATTLADYCYCSMFNNCTNLTTAPVLPATTLRNGCYSSMFSTCTGLINAPELPATTLENRCYSSMFHNCQSLTIAPALPATQLRQECYRSMFEGCTSLTSAPILPATTLYYCSYSKMFYNCTNLNYIKAMFTTTPSNATNEQYTTNWVYGVASTGTFVKNAAATWNITGVDGVPEGWTVETATA